MSESYTIYTVDTFDYEMFDDIKIVSKRSQKHLSRRPDTIIDLVTAFDIETTYYPEHKQSAMYVWQWAFGKDKVVIGRTWQDYIRFCKRLLRCLAGRKLIVYVHNLSYEFQFLKGAYNFNSEEVFAIQKRKILKASMSQLIEMRCSYIHANDTLAKFCEKMNVVHQKEENYDYEKIRESDTGLTESELKYICHDVVGLVEAIENEMEKDGDNLITIPLTSTGYVRRDIKTSINNKLRDVIVDMLPDRKLYDILREAFRGGNTHANRHYTGRITPNILSLDLVSAYPNELCNKLFPWKMKGVKPQDIMSVVKDTGYATVARYRFTNIRIINDSVGIPYLSYSKCRNVDNAIEDNGRIISADSLDTTLTDIDYQIMCKCYNWEDCTVKDMYYGVYKTLPYEIIRTLQYYFHLKTSLKNVPEKSHEYEKTKNKLNGIYGLMAQDPLHKRLNFTRDSFGVYIWDILFDDNNESLTKALLPYQWGVWTTAHTRYSLQQGIDIAGRNCIYCDTDSVKLCLPSLTDSDIDKYYHPYKTLNDTKQQTSRLHDVDPSGKHHYAGMWEIDGRYRRFLTWGAKKYAYETEENELRLTVAGVAKKAGAKELLEAGGLEAFFPGIRRETEEGEIYYTNGFTFKTAAGLEARYNDTILIKDDHVFTPNIALSPSTYTLSITEEYEDIIGDFPLYEKYVLRDIEQHAQRRARWNAQNALRKEAKNKK